MFLQKTAKIAPCDSESEKVNEQLRQICSWLDENPYINACKDLENILFFLKSCKYDLERTKKKIKCFYQMRAERVEWFENRDPLLPEIQELLHLGVFLPVDGTDEEGRKVVVIRTAAHDPKRHTQNNVFKVGKMILDLLLKMEPENCLQGIVAIFDMNGLQLGHALQMNPKLIKRAVHSWQTYPCQPKILEFVNSPSYLNVVLNTFRLFMTAKMRSRVVVRKNLSAVKCEALPSDVGGNGLCYKDLAAKWKTLVEENVDFYEKYDKYKSDLRH